MNWHKIHEIEHTPDLQQSHDHIPSHTENYQLSCQICSKYFINRDATFNCMMMT